MDMTSDGLETKAGAGSDIGALFAEFSTAFEEFKRTNDQRLGEIEKRGSADGLLEGKLDRLNSVLDGQKAAMDRAMVERARPLLDGRGAPLGGEYKEAFASYVKRGEEKALSVGVNADGGYVVPPETETEITRLMTAVSPIRAIAGVRQVSGSVYKRPISVTGPATGWVGETAARPTTNSQTLAELSYPTMELYAMPAATSSFLDDAAVDVGQWISDEVNAAFAAQETTAFVTGNGVNKPTGFLTATSVAEASWTWGNLGYIATGTAGALARRITARSLPSGHAQAPEVDRPLPGGVSVAVRALPLVMVAHLPPLPSDPSRSRLVVAAYTQPWPGRVQVVDDATGTTLAELTRRGLLGSLTADLQAGPLGIWDQGNVVDVTLLEGHLASGEDLAVLGGSNRLAVENDAGNWEVVGFANAELVSPGRYRLSRLLRGMDCTGPAMSTAPVGRRVILLDSRAVSLPMDAHWLGETRTFRIYAGARDVEGQSLSFATDAGPALPLPPVHLRAVRAGGDVAFNWTRCSRADGDGWGAAESPLEHVPERYQLTIFNGSTPVRLLESTSPAASYGAADQVSDFGVLPAVFNFTVVQVSPVLGGGHAAEGAFHG